jgi:hypothetical protein
MTTNSVSLVHASVLHIVVNRVHRDYKMCQRNRHGERLDTSHGERFDTSTIQSMSHNTLSCVHITLHIDTECSHRCYTRRRTHDCRCMHSSCV